MIEDERREASARLPIAVSTNATLAER